MLLTNLRRLPSSAIGGALFLIFATTTRAAAQGAVSDLAAGARIKLVAPKAGVPWSAIGIVDSVGEDTLYVRSLSEPPSLRSASRVSVPFTSIQRLAISGGRVSRVGRAGRGALWGLAVYAIFASTYIVHERNTCRGADCFGEGFAWIGLAAGVPWSAGIGAAVGAVLPVERWHRVTLDASR
jgi:hypothetical protein